MDTTLFLQTVLLCHPVTITKTCIYHMCPQYRSKLTMDPWCSAPANPYLHFLGVCRWLTPSSLCNIMSQLLGLVFLFCCHNFLASCQLQVFLFLQQAGSHIQQCIVFTKKSLNFIKITEATEFRCTEPWMRIWLLTALNPLPNTCTCIVSFGFGLMSY